MLMAKKYTSPMPKRDWRGSTEARERVSSSFFSFSLHASKHKETVLLLGTAGGLVVRWCPIFQEPGLQIPKPSSPNRHFGDTWIEEKATHFQSKVMHRSKGSTQSPVNLEPNKKRFISRGSSFWELHRKRFHVSGPCFEGTAFMGQFVGKHKGHPPNH